MIWLGVLFGKNSILVLPAPTDMPKNIKAEMRSSTVEPKYQYTFLPVKALFSCLSYQFSKRTKLPAWNLLAHLLIPYLYAQNKAAVRIIKVPKPLIAPPNTRMNSPKPPKINEILMSCLRLSSLSPTSMNLETNMEFIKMATNKEEPNTTDKVMGK